MKLFPHQLVSSILLFETDIVIRMAVRERRFDKPPLECVGKSLFERLEEIESDITQTTITLRNLNEILEKKSKYASIFLTFLGIMCIVLGCLIFSICIKSYKN
eukprot:NODE_389_length_8228_cov_1.280600.p8 type:complete len:103 gc:universal NODE_389_length_8228_cov_1.280600:7612-7304(-)